MNTLRITPNTGRVSEGQEAVARAALEFFSADLGITPPVLTWFAEARITGVTRVGEGRDCAGLADGHTVAVRAGLAESDLIQVVAHEVRHVWQASRDELLRIGGYCRGSAGLARYEADARAYAADAVRRFRESSPGAKTFGFQAYALACLRRGW